MKQKSLKRIALMLIMTVAMTFTLAIPQDALAATKTPSKVATVKVSSYDYNKVKISWSKAKNSKKYRVYQATSKRGKYKSVGTTTKRTLINSGLVTGKTYYYKVRGINGKKLGKLSAPKEVKPKLRTVKGLDGDVASNTSLKITWKKVNGAKGYQLYKATSPKGKYKKVKSTSRLSYTNGGLVKNKAYYYKVRAYRKVGKKYVYSSFCKPIGRKIVVVNSKDPLSIRKEMLKQVNAKRAKAKVPPLKAYDIIDYTAQVKAVDMLAYNYFDHYSPRLGTVYNQYASVGLEPFGGENIAYGQRSVTQVMNAWMNSKGHRANILRKEFTHLGVGYINGYWVQQFYVKY